MPTAPRTLRSLAALTLVVSLLASGSAGSVLATQRELSSAPDRAAAQRSGSLAHAAPGVRPVADYDRGVTLRSGLLTTRPASVVAPVVTGGNDWVRRADVAAPTPKAKTESKSRPRAESSASSGGGTNSSRSTSYRGRNHVWIPALGIDRSVTGYACSKTSYPGNRVYRWGCAGNNNVYLFGHAHSVFRSLHDAYVRGRLSKSMKVYYASSSGKVSTYKVAWWKVTTPDKGAWAYAGQSRPSLTLQTCVGAKSQFRLIVRLYKVG
ncbi:MAG TPA: sortase [Candidatus Saccharimonadales bacterium]|nr:sortase [Candidatus Saccharimonadales bacterium]